MENQLGRSVVSTLPSPTSKNKSPIVAGGIHAIPAKKQNADSELKPAQSRVTSIVQLRTSDVSIAVAFRCTARASKHFKGLSKGLFHSICCLSPLLIHQAIVTTLTADEADETLMEMCVHIFIWA